jgi:predicted MFS family arabinose efflux permease
MTRRVVLWSLCSMVFVVNLGRVVFAPLLETFMTAFAIGPGTAGLVTTVLWVGATLPSIGVGYLLTKVSKHRVILFGAGLLAASSALVAVSTTVATLVLGSFLVGLAASLYFTTASPMLSDVFPESLGRAIGIHGAVMMVASVAAPLYVSVVLVNFVDWRYVFWLLSAFAVVTLVAFHLTLRRRPVETSGPDGDVAFLRAVVRHRRLIATGILLFGVTGFVWQGVFNFYVSYLVDAKQADPAFARNMLGVVFFAGIPSFYLSGRVADRFPKIPATVTFLCGFIVSLVVLTYAAGRGQLLAISVVMGFTFHGIVPIFHTYVLESLPAATQESAFSVYLGVNGAIGATGSLVVGLLLELGFGYADVYQVYAGALVMVAATSLVLYRYRVI